MHASVVGDSDHASGAAGKVPAGCFPEPQAEGSDMGGGGGRAATGSWNQQCIGSGKGPGGPGGECQ